MKDVLLRMIDRVQNLRIFAAETTELVEAARKTHNLPPIPAAALGRALTAGAMMGAMLKNSTDKLTIQVKGEGPLGGIIVVGDDRAAVKGYVYNSDVYLPPNQHGKLDVGGAVGKKGYLNVIKDLGLKEPYIGLVPLISGEIGEDLSYYFLKSEQIPSLVALGVLIKKTGEVAASGGFIIQVMPEAGDSIIEKIEDNSKNLSSVTSYLLQGKSIKQVIEEHITKTEIHVIDTLKPQYICDCSRERMERALISLGKQELMNILEAEETIEIECHFCLQKYRFERSQVEDLLKG